MENKDLVRRMLSGVCVSAEGDNIGVTSTVSHCRGRFNLRTDRRRIRQLVRRLLAGPVSALSCASSAITCCLSTLATHLGPETLNIHAIFQMSGEICWLAPRVCVGPPLVTLLVNCVLLC